LRAHKRSKMTSIGNADGNIMAAIITAHMHPTATALAVLQADDAGIVSCASGWPMSSASQASNAHAITLSARVCVATLRP